MYVSGLMCHMGMKRISKYVSVCGGALLDRPCIVFQRMCVLCL